MALNNEKAFYMSSLRFVYFIFLSQVGGSLLTLRFSVLKVSRRAESVVKHQSINNSHLTMLDEKSISLWQYTKTNDTNKSDKRSFLHYSVQLYKAKKLEI